ncbi:hypothetical protein B296_00034182 [Ensete ventricosum]|uniref:Uncharacterized protein n=1 Tax=Ensete ventricosum TaxID=4639 RepID=A0A426YG30_ENSVE|nr:hypothetical protein B296_00034182 [Ensete ventricosum]
MEGIGSLPGWHKEIRQKKIETYRKIIGGSRKACREDDHAACKGNRLWLGPPARAEATPTKVAPVEASPMGMTPTHPRRLARAGDLRRSKGVAIVHSCGSNFLRAYPGRTIEPRGIKDKGHSPTSHAKAYYPLYCHLSPCTKKLTRDELRERSTKELCWHYNEPWSHEHYCKKGRLLVIELAEDEDNETSEEALEPKEEAI